MLHAETFLNSTDYLAALYVAAISLLTLLLYYIDKSAARRGSRRIQERTLHLAALIGGWPGALAGRHLFRHKTRKQPFRTIFWCTVIANIAALIWFFLGDGATLLESLSARIQHLYR